MTQLCGVKLTPAERRLIEWLRARYDLGSHSEVMRHLLHQAARLNGAPCSLRVTAAEERDQIRPFRRGEDMVEPDELQQKVLDLTGKDSGK